MLTENILSCSDWVLVEQIFFLVFRWSCGLPSNAIFRFGYGCMSAEIFVSCTDREGFNGIVLSGLSRLQMDFSRSVGVDNDI